MTAFRHEPPKCLTTFQHVLDFWSVCTWVVVRRRVWVSFKLSVGERDVQGVAKSLELFECNLLLLVGRVTSREAGTEAVALNGLGKNNGWLTCVCTGSSVCSVDLAVVVATALQSPDLVVGHVLNELLGTWVTVEEVLANECAVVCLVCLVVTVWGDVHEVYKCAVLVSVQQGVPLAAPNNLDNVPARTLEEGFEFLDDLAVTANWAVQTLQVAVNHEG